MLTVSDFASRMRNMIRARSSKSTWHAQSVEIIVSYRMTADGDKQALAPDEDDANPGPSIAHRQCALNANSLGQDDGKTQVLSYSC